MKVNQAFRGQYNDMTHQVEKILKKFVSFIPFRVLIEYNTLYYFTVENSFAVLWRQ